MSATVEKCAKTHPADDLVKRLRLCADDPMWADHAEVSKTLLARAATALTASREEVERLTARLAIVEPAADSFHKRMVSAEARVAELLEALRSVAQLRASIKTWALNNRIPGWQNEDDLFAAIDAVLAKVAAQADYEARIRSALATPTAALSTRGINAGPAFIPLEQQRQRDADYFGQLVLRARIAAAKATAKFPQPNYITLKIAEEAGEVVRGAVHYAEGRMEWTEVEGEIVQLLAMLIRFVTEGDQINGVTPPIAPTAEEK
ncbi:MAG: hypothetical protein ACYCZ0_00030 [Minisyncoccota bacterium]